MRSERLIRHQALQLLCQFDAGNEELVRTTTTDFDEELSETTAPVEDAMQLAKLVWADKENADAEISKHTPDWPIHRQPIIDRNILRLARFEINSNRTPPKVAIDEAIELARIFSTEQSPAFVNGVLDTIFSELIAASGTE